MVTIWINGEKIELLDRVPLTQTIQANDVTQVARRQKNFTNRFKVPFTPNNRRIMDNLAIVGNVSEKPYIALDVRVAINGIEIINGGVARIDKATDAYELVIYSGSAEFFDEVGKYKLTDIDFTDLDHTLNMTNYVNSLGNTSGYIYPVADYGFYDSVLPVDFQVPAIFLPTIMDRVFNLIGFTKSGDIFTDQNYLDHVIPIVKGFSNGADNSVTFKDIDFWAVFVSGGSSSTITLGTQTTNFDGVARLVISTQIEPNNIEFARILIENNGTQVRSYTVINDDAPINELMEIDLSVMSGDVITYKLQYFVGGGTPIELSGHVDATLNQVTTTLNESVVFADLLPDISVADLLKEFLVEFGQVPFPSDKNVHFVNVGDLISDRDSSVDWSDKFVSVQTRKYQPTGYGQLNKMLYSYNDEIEAYADGEFDVDNENLQSEKTVYSSKFFAPDPTTKQLHGQDIFRHTLYKLDDDDELELVEGKKLFNRIVRVDDVLQYGVRSVGVPFGIHDDIFPILGFDGWQKWIDEYHKPFIHKAIDRFKLFTCMFKLNERDIYFLDLSKLIYVKQLGSYALVNKVHSFQAGKLTKVDIVLVAAESNAEPPIASTTFSSDTILYPTENSITLDGTLSSDPDGSIVSYAWSQVSGPAGATIVTPTTATTQIQFSGSPAGVHVFRLTVTDNDGLTDTADVTITVDTNNPPTADAGGNQTVVTPATVTLNGTGSTDGDGTITTYLWQKVAGPAGGTINSPNTATTSVTGLPIGSHHFDLTVTDDDGATDTDTVIITVTDGTQINIINQSTTIAWDGTEAEVQFDVEVIGGTQSFDWVIETVGNGHNCFVELVDPSLSQVGSITGVSPKSSGNIADSLTTGTHGKYRLSIFRFGGSTGFLEFKASIYKNGVFKASASKIVTV